MDYSKKVILVTGASSGIGRAVAIALSHYNNHIGIVARRKDMLLEVKEEIEKNKSTCSVYPGDALDESFCQETINDLANQHGRVDLAILNIGIGPPSNTLNAPAEIIKKSMKVNYFTFINFYVPLIQVMKKQKGRCMICHMNSLASFFGIPMQGDYTAAKGAVRLFIQTARMELKHFGYNHIQLQTIHPGFVDTDAVRDDGIPAPNEISEEEAALYILKGIKKEKRENMFPFLTTIGARVARRFLPEGIITKVLLSQTPKNY